jgi:macrolide-specific efflux system membrane fusion protein
MKITRKRLAAVALSACALIYVAARAAIPEKKAIPPSDIVEVGDLRKFVRASGVVNPAQKVDVAAQVNGQVKSIHVRLGQSVKAGDLLVNLEADLPTNDVRQAEASLAQQSALIRMRGVDLEAANLELERQLKLSARAATSAQELEKARQDVRRISADIEASQANQRKLEAELAKRRLSLRYTEVRAPIDGEVVNIAVQEGQTVLSMQLAPVLLTIADMKSVRIKARVAEADIQGVKVGQNASFTPLGASSKHSGTVSFVQPMPERVGNGLFYNVMFELPNTDGNLLLDMTVAVQILTESIDKALTVAVKGLGERTNDGLYSVQVLDRDGNQAARYVRVGLQDGHRAEVKDGLSLGERVAVGVIDATNRAPSSALKRGSL